MRSISESRLSLIIATYNRGPRIARTLDSVLRQTIAPMEIIVVDDCSTDGTAEWVRTHYPQVRVVQTPQNSGTSGARNFGARQAVNPLLAFLDHDDELLPQALEVLVANLVAFSEARASFADHTYINHVTGVRYESHHYHFSPWKRLHSIRPHRQDGRSRLYGREMYYGLLWGNLLQQPWVIYRDTFFQLGGFAEDIRYCEDWDLNLRLARTVPLVLSDEVISYWHVEGENLHLRPGQGEMQLRVLRRRWAEHPWYHLRIKRTLLRRLALYYKWDGDRARQTSLALAWRLYCRSLFHWPLDYVVAVRTVFWPLQMAFGIK